MREVPSAALILSLRFSSEVDDVASSEAVKGADCEDNLPIEEPIRVPEEGGGPTTVAAPTEDPGIGGKKHPGSAYADMNRCSSQGGSESMCSVNPN